jgi:hypothetical protein
MQENGAAVAEHFVQPLLHFRSRERLQQDREAETGFPALGAQITDPPKDAACI